MQNFCPNGPMPLRSLQAGSKYFLGGEFIHKNVSAICCLDSEEHSRPELLHIWNDCFGFDSVITFLIKESRLYKDILLKQDKVLHHS